MNNLLGRWSAWDRQLSGRAAKLVKKRSGWVVAWLLAHSGDSQWWVLVGLLLWWLGEGGKRQAGMRIVLITLACGLLSTLLKRLVRRPRPAGKMQLFYLPIDPHSFPSGHATRVGGLAVALGLMLPIWGAVLLVCWALAVGLSRVALEIHYAADVAAGMLLGAFLGTTLLLFGL